MQVGYPTKALLPELIMWFDRFPNKYFTFKSNIKVSNQRFSLIDIPVKLTQIFEFYIDYL